MLITITTLALLLQATPPTPPTRTPEPRVKVHAPKPPHAGRYRDRDRDSDADEGLTRDTTFAVRQGQRLDVDNFSGSITVTAWNDDRIRISAPSNSGLESR